MKRFDSGIRSIRLRRLLGAALCLAAAGSLSTQASAQPPANQGFTEATDVVAVEVPVQVIRDGQPVRGLTAADFEVYEGKKRQPITGFEVLDLATLEAGPGELKLAKAKVPAAARRRFLLLFDMSFSDNAALTKARDAAKDMVRTSFHPTDLIGVATYRRSRGPELLLGFTSDRRQVEDALNKLGAMERNADPLRLVSGPPFGLGGVELLTSGAIDMGPPGGRRTEREDGGGAVNESPVGATSTVSIGSIPNFGELSRSADKQTAMEQDVREVTGFSRSLADFSKMLGSIQGRKYVIFLSEGFNGQLLTGTQDDVETQTMDESVERGAYWNVNTTNRHGNTHLTNEVEKMLEELRRADCVIHAVDIGGLRAFGGEAGVKAAAGGQESLFLMADSTGGELIRNFNNLSEAMGKVLQRTSVTYVLTYQPDGVKHDGAYRKLRVELKNAPRGTRVSFRPGYYAPKPFAQRSGLEKALDAASQLVSGRDGGTVAASVLAAPFAAPGERAYVPVLIEIDGKGLIGGKPGATLPIEIYAYAMDAGGEVQDYFAKTLGFDLAKVGPALQQSGLKFYGDLWLPPGSYSLRVLVRNSENGASSLRVATLEVPAFGPTGQAFLLPPFFPEPPNRWLLVRESNEMPKNVSYPFMLQEQPYIPAARPVLQAQQEVRMSLVGYHLRPGDFKADSLVLTADGKEIGPGEVRVLDRRGGAEGSDRLVATFRPPALQPGEYLLLLTLTDSTGAVETSTTPFVIAAAAQGATR
ncbi:MAG TPA: VWA domain-containing protein [Thermoanaerobaculia bacterium]